MPGRWKFGEGACSLVWQQAGCLFTGPLPGAAHCHELGSPHDATFWQTLCTRENTDTRPIYIYLFYEYSSNVRTRFPRTHGQANLC